MPQYNFNGEKIMNTVTHRLTKADLDRLDEATVYVISGVKIDIYSVRTTAILNNANAVVGAAMDKMMGEA